MQLLNTIFSPSLVSSGRCQDLTVLKDGKSRNLPRTSPTGSEWQAWTAVAEETSVPLGNLRRAILDSPRHLLLSKSPRYESSCRNGYKIWGIQVRSSHAGVLHGSDRWFSPHRVGVALQHVRENSGIFHVPGGEEDTRKHPGETGRSDLYTHLPRCQNLMYSKRPKSE